MWKIPLSVKNFACGGPIRWKLQSTIGWWRWRQKLPQQKLYSWFWIISTRLTQNATRKHGTSAKSHWKNYILLWKNEIYSGKHLEKSWKNDPERLCEPWAIEYRLQPSVNKNVDWYYLECNFVRNMGFEFGQGHIYYII